LAIFGLLFLFGFLIFSLFFLLFLNFDSFLPDKNVSVMSIEFKEEEEVTVDSGEPHWANQLIGYWKNLIALIL